MYLLSRVTKLFPDEVDARPFIAAVTALEEILNTNKVCESHGVRHALTVAAITAKALNASQVRLPPAAYLEVVMAALLHDADDHKFFPGHSDYQNARSVLNRAGIAAQENILLMIQWVSSSSNGDLIPEPAVEKPWLLYPRWADRIAAIGWEGVERCWQYTVSSDRPLYTTETLRATSAEDLYKNIATEERYRNYKGSSASMIDHYYDKLLRVSDAVIAQENSYLRKEALGRRGCLEFIVLTFGEKGCLPPTLRKHANSFPELY